VLKLAAIKDYERKVGIRPIYKTTLGTMYKGRIETFLESEVSNYYKGKIGLILTSPPFPLNRKKKYGNKEGDEYLEWLRDLASPLAKLLKPKGSIVLEIGNAWEKGKPTMSTLTVRSLLEFLNSGSLKLCEQFVCFNPARLPGPAQWVNVERIRVKDAFTNAWWMSPSERPNADNRRILEEYSESMKKLLSRGSYDYGKRPSEHNIGKSSFLKNNRGAIPSNVLIFSNTESNSDYLNYCRSRRIKLHPARMPEHFAEFFVKFLTNSKDIVLDPFAGSNTVGAIAERLGRKWISIEPRSSYIKGSVGRFKGTKMIEIGKM
jgi:site-specific DNA-methyltransferase (cytosine-N4-specific)